MSYKILTQNLRELVLLGLQKASPRRATAEDIRRNIGIHKDEYGRVYNALEWHKNNGTIVKISDGPGLPVEYRLKEI